VQIHNYGRFVGGRNHANTNQTSVGVHQFATYRSAKNFANPDQFVPERWLSDRPDEYKDDVKGAFQPFHLGPRGCIGKK
jgi:cytochrome P450